MGDDDTTIGTYFNADEQAELLSEFDDRFDERSSAVKDSMRLYIAVDKALDGIGYEFGREVEKRTFVRQAILDQFRREQDSDA